MPPSPPSPQPPPHGSGTVPARYDSPVTRAFPDGRLDLDLTEVAGPPEPVLPAVAMDALVDAVVDRIERRVVEELERRGRRQSWGAF